MSSVNMSFATRKYMSKHGLISSENSRMNQRHFASSQQAKFSSCSPEHLENQQPPHFDSDELNESSPCSKSQTRTKEIETKSMPAASGNVPAYHHQQHHESIMEEGEGSSGVSTALEVDDRKLKNPIHSAKQPKVHGKERVLDIVRLKELPKLF